jgi:hypothetical protein
LPSFAPKIRVEVYLPVRYEAAYQDTLAWVIREFTELHGGCTEIENAGGYYLSKSNQIIDDRVSLIYLVNVLHRTLLTNPFQLRPRSEFVEWFLEGSLRVPSR